MFMLVTLHFQVTRIPRASPSPTRDTHECYSQVSWQALQHQVYKLCVTIRTLAANLNSRGLLIGDTASYIDVIFVRVVVNLKSYSMF